jgi:hypothetical protein
MKTISFIIATFLLSTTCIAQSAKVIVFKHELRWTDETKFPNYFLIPELRDAIFNETRLELMNYLKVPDVKLPEDVEYQIMNGFGKQKVELPNSASGSDPVIGIFSFITRATSGYAIFWKLNIIIKQNSKIILQKEVSHELEYFNVSGYVDLQQWMSANEFQEIFKRLIKEALGAQPATDEKIIVGSLEAEEDEARALLYQPVRYLLKINGAWKSAGNFSAMLESENDTITDFYFKEGWTSQYALPTMTSVLSSLFSDVTGVDLLYDQKVTNQQKGTLRFSDGSKLGIILKWIAIETRSTMSNEVTTQISDPLTAEIYNDKEQAGYFLYTREQVVHSTDKTKEKFDVFVGYQKQNTLGIEMIHRIEGSLFNKSIFAEYNQNHGNIKIMSGDEMIGVMVVQNCNPENRSIGNATLSKNKHTMSTGGQSVVKPSLENTKSVEWYPIYFPGDASVESFRVCLETLICLFFGIGNM